jgi:hypothetical protein
MAVNQTFTRYRITNHQDNRNADFDPEMLRHIQCMLLIEECGGALAPPLLY